MIEKNGEIGFTKQKNEAGNQKINFFLELLLYILPFFDEKNT